MALPIYSSIETPILQELAAIGGEDDVRFLYSRLVDYFPQITQAEIFVIKSGNHKYWRSAVQKAGKSLDEQNLIKRNRGIWKITQLGEQMVSEETSGFTLTKVELKEISHSEVQQMLVNIGKALGYNAEIEFDYYDVVWRISPTSQRLSHIFEVQSKGNIDSAFAKLKRGYEAQRSRPFLVLSTERDLNRAKKSLTREYQDLEQVLTILTFHQIVKVYKNLSKIAWILTKFLEN